MTPVNDALPITYTIAAIAHDTGIGKDTLRVWERRYGFPAPERNANGERSYPAVQLQKLGLIKRLIDQGHRPGRVVPLPMDALQQLCQEARTRSHAPSPQTVGAGAEAGVGADDLLTYLAYLQTQDHEGLSAALHTALAQLGLQSFVCNVVAPLTAHVGEAWARGALAVHEEHLYTECVNRLLRQAIAQIAPAARAGPPTVLLTTIVHEPHGLGLLMAECLLTLQGCRCLSLGTQTPINDIAQAALAHRVDAVALSFSSYLKPSTVAESLHALRRLLPAQLALWVGGQAPVLRRRVFEGVTPLHDAAAIAQAVAHWRGSG